MRSASARAASSWAVSDSSTSARTRRQLERERLLSFLVQLLRLGALGFDAAALSFLSLDLHLIQGIAEGQLGFRPHTRHLGGQRVARLTFGRGARLGDRGLAHLFRFGLHAQPVGRKSLSRLCLGGGTRLGDRLFAK